MKTEIWNGYEIRFVEKDGEWWAVAADIAKALGHRDAEKAVRALKDKYKGTHKVGITSHKTKSRKSQDMTILNEKGIYRLIMRSNKPEAEAFQDCVYELLSTLRKKAGFEGFQAFRMLDKDIQKEQMALIHNNIPEPTKRDYIKANTITDKAVSNRFGCPKMVKKAEMTAEMLRARPKVLEDTVALMIAKERFGLDISVSETIYRKVRGEECPA